MSSARRPKTKRPPRPSTAPGGPASGNARAAAAKKRSRPPPLPQRRPRATVEAPEIRFEYGPAGRETLAAIAEEVAGLARAIAARPHNASAPEISITESPAGRETISAIAREVAEQVRPKLTTLNYDEPPEARALPSEPTTAVRRRLPTRGYSEAPPPPEPEPEAPQTTAVPAGRDTLEAIARAVAGPESGPRVREELDVYEMATFVVRGNDLARLSTENGRREFVGERLLARLPVASLDDVDRIDVTPWTVRGTLIVRVWCRLPAG